MKKLLTLMLCSILLFSLTACGNTEKSKQEDSNPNEETNQETLSPSQLESQFIGEWTGKSSTKGDVKWIFEEGGKATCFEYLSYLPEPEWKSKPAIYEVINGDTINIKFDEENSHLSEFNYEINGNELSLTFVKAVDLPEEQQTWYGLKSYELSKVN